VPRIASLLPSATETVCALGGVDDLVGVSHECDWPPEVAARVADGRLPVLTTARLGPPGPLGHADGYADVGEQPCMSAAIDAQLRRLVAESLSVYIVDEHALAAAAPDVVLTQDLCEVCAVSFAETCRAVAYLAPGSARVVTSHPLTLEDILADMREVGAAIGRDAAAVDFVHTCALRIKRVSARSADAARASGAPRVLTIEWIDPPMPGGLWMTELIELAGGISLDQPEGEHSRVLSRAELEALAPDVVVVKPCGFTLAQTLAEAGSLRRVLPAHWPACADSRVYLCDGSAYFNRPGPRIVESLELLASCVHPQAFPDFAAEYAPAVHRSQD
jgi:iron complex transport system substrate-binding protein